MTRDVDPVRLYAAHTVAAEFYRAQLPGSVRALAYLRSRGIMATTAHQAPWMVGYAGPGWTALREHLCTAGFADTELLAAGLATTSRTGGIVDAFRNRVMFAIRDPDGRVVAFTGRDVSGRDGARRDDTPKWRNSPATAIYAKKQLLYGLAEQLAADTKPAAVMLVEGPADVLAIARLRQALPAPVYPRHYYAVAPCGTALTAEQVALLADTVPAGTPMVVAFDADTAGAGAADRARTLLRGWPGPVDALALPAGEDPASLLARLGPAATADLLTAARRPLVELVIEHRLAPRLARLHERQAELARLGLDRTGDTLPIRVAALHAVAPLVGEIADRDPTAAARHAINLAVRLDLAPLTVHEAIYPTGDTASATADPEAAARATPPAPDGQQRRGPSRAAGFAHPDVGHDYALLCPDTGGAAVWVQHDPDTGHTAWVIAEGVTDHPADRTAARLAAEVAGRVGVLVGAHHAVEIARAALNTHFASRTTAGQGNATIAVLTTFDGARPIPGTGRFTIAWAGDSRVYGRCGTGGAWFAQLTIDHTVGAQATARDPARRARPSDDALTATVRAGPIGTNRIDLPVTELLLTSRRLNTTDPLRLGEAIEGRGARDAVRHVGRLLPAQLAETLYGASTPAAIGQLGAATPAVPAAFVIRPRGGQHTVTPAQLARQDQAATAANTDNRLPVPRRISAAPRSPAATAHSRQHH